MCRNKDKHQWPGQNKNEYRNNKAKNKGNPNGDPDSFADTFVFSSSEILSDKSREGISEILNRHISKRIDFNCRSKASRLCFIGQNMEKAGRTAARMADILLEGRGRAAILGSSNPLLPVSGREQGFRNYMAESAPRMHIMHTIDTNENPSQAYQQTIALLKNDPPDIIFATSGCVAEIGNALKTLPAEKRPYLICFERYPSIETLLQDGTIPCTISSDLLTQGYEGIKYLFEFILFERRPSQDAFYMPIGILLKENL